MLDKIYKDKDKFSGIVNILTLKLQSLLISIDKSDFYLIPISIILLLYYPIKLKYIFMLIVVIFLLLTNFILIYSYFLKAPSGNILI